MGPDKRDRGSTLVELCVVMALVAIVGTAVVSFSVMISGYTGRMALDSQVKEGLAYVELALDVWLPSMEAEGASVEVSESGGALTATAGDKTYTLSLKNGSITGSLPDGSTLSYTADGLQSLSFAIKTKAEQSSDPRLLVVCTVTHETPFSTDGLSDTTLLMRATRAGEVLP